MIRHLLSTTLILLAVNFTTGCETLGYQQAEDASYNLSNLTLSMELAATNASATGTALTALRSGTELNLATPFEAFLTNNEDYRQNIARARQELSRAESELNYYYINWENNLATLTDDGMRAAGHARLTESRQEWQQLLNRVNTSLATASVHQTQFQEIQQYLSVDLTSRGIRSINSNINEAIIKTNPVQQDLLAATQAVEQFSTNILPIRPANSTQ